MQSKTILIADDSPLQAIMLRRSLMQEGFNVLTMKNGQEALECLKKNEVMLVISDINMPIMNGYELCQAIKNDPALDHIPVILCTVLSSPLDLIKGIEVGADNYITRPWNEENMLALVKELIHSPYHVKPTKEVEEVVLNGKAYQLSTSRQYILNFLLSTYQNVHKQNQELTHLREEIQKAYGQLKNTQKEQEQILLNIFPELVAQELIAYGSVNPMRYEEASVMFIDFVGFTKGAANMTPQDLVAALSFYFEKFDEIIEQHNLERIKTIGDGYMCVGGVPTPSETHAIDCALAALDIQKFILNSAEKIKEKYKVEWKARIGIHTGPLVAGVIGKKRLAYDVWGPTVNIANRLESHCQPGKINISNETYQKVKDLFAIDSRGVIGIKNKEGLEMLLEMYFIEGLKSNAGRMTVK